jgi:16S rRNA G966 N2-methylase RsmD
LVCLEKNVETSKRYRELNCTFSVAHRAAEVHLRKLVAAGEMFSLIFADPPYGEAAQALLREEALPRLLTDDGWLVLESAKRDALAVGAPWERMRGSIYGDTQVTYLRRAGASANRDG